MRGALSVGLGIAKTGHSIEVCGGDIEFVIPLCGLTTASKYKDNIVFRYFICDNESTKRNGRKNIYQRHIDCKSLCHSSGISSVEMNYGADAFARDIDSFCDEPGLHVLVVKLTSILKYRDHRWMR